jgi:UPF0755 protein
MLTGCVLAAVLSCTTAGDPDLAEVVVAPGASARAVAESLSTAKVVRFPTFFRLYLALRGHDRSIKPGTYRLDRKSSWESLLSALVSGKGLVYPVVVPEGYSLREIVALLAQRTPWGEDSLLAAARDPELLARLEIPATTLEGYLFPATYAFPHGASARKVVETMVAEFERRWKREWDSRLAALGMTRHQVVTLASIVEREALRSEEAPLIAAVFHNRLKRGIPLQADPTVQYALGAHRSRLLHRDLEIDSPYNTYRRPGLPPGPIGSPGSAAIEAVLFPAQVPFLYFVAHPDGHHEFRRTFREHLEAIRQLRAAGSGGQEDRK